MTDTPIGRRMLPDEFEAYASKLLDVVAELDGTSIVALANSLQFAGLEKVRLTTTASIAERMANDLVGKTIAQYRQFEAAALAESAELQKAKVDKKLH